MSVHRKFDPLRSLARVAKLRHMDMQCDPQCVLDLIAERDALAQRCQSLEEAVERMDSCNKAIAADALVACSERDALRGLLAECAEYLNTNNLTSIGHGSILHRKMIDAAMEAPR